MKASDAGQSDSNDASKTADLAWRSVSTTLAGLLLYGGGGWLLGSKYGHQDVFTAAGSILGIVLALYITYKRVGNS